MIESTNTSSQYASDAFFRTSPKPKHQESTNTDRLRRWKWKFSLTFTINLNTVLCFLRMIFCYIFSFDNRNRFVCTILYKSYKFANFCETNANFCETNVLSSFSPCPYERGHCSRLKFVIFHHGVRHCCYGNCLVTFVPVIDLSAEFRIFYGRNSTFVFWLHVRLLKN